MIITQKHKVILLVFGFLLATIIVMYIIDKGLSKSKKEHFEENEDEEDDTEAEEEKEQYTNKQRKYSEKFTETSKETKKDDSKELKKTEKSSSSPQNSFNFLSYATDYVNSLNIPFTQKKETFKELFSDYNIEKIASLTPTQIKDFVSSIVEKAKEKFEDLSDTPSKTDTDTSNNSRLDTIKTHLKQIETEVNALYTVKTSPSTEFFKPATQTPQLQINHNGDDKKKHSNNLIEGFENYRHNYASY